MDRELEREKESQEKFRRELRRILKAERDNRKTVIFPTVGEPNFSPPNPRYAGLKSYHERYQRETGIKFRYKEDEDQKSDQALATEMGTV